MDAHLQHLFLQGCVVFRSKDGLAYVSVFQALADVTVAVDYFRDFFFDIPFEVGTACLVHNSALIFVSKQRIRAEN